MRLKCFFPNGTHSMNDGFVSLNGYCGITGTGAANIGMGVVGATQQLFLGLVIM